MRTTVKQNSIVYIPTDDHALLDNGLNSEVHLSIEKEMKHNVNTNQKIPFKVVNELIGKSIVFNEDKNRLEIKHDGWYEISVSINTSNNPKRNKKTNSQVYINFSQDIISEVKSINTSFVGYAKDDNKKQANHSGTIKKYLESGSNIDCSFKTIEAVTAYKISSNQLGTYLKIKRLIKE